MFDVVTGVVVETLAVAIGIELLANANINVSAAVTTTSEFPTPILEEDFSC